MQIKLDFKQDVVTVSKDNAGSDRTEHAAAAFCSNVGSFTTLISLRIRFKSAINTQFNVENTCIIPQLSIMGKTNSMNNCNNKIYLYSRCGL